MTGPIANKVLHNLHKVKQSKIVNFGDIKSAKEYQAQLKKERVSKDFSELDPLHSTFKLSLATNIFISKFYVNVGYTAKAID